MPKIDLTGDNKVQQYTDYPKLTLEHGERALIVCIEPQPTVEFRHTLEAPEIGPDGKVLKEERKTQKGEKYEAVVNEFMGNHLCIGDYTTVKDKGTDPDNCPTCQAAQEEEGIKPPVQHYAMHVIKYSLQPGSFAIREPFNVDLVAWVFSPTRLNTIIDLASEWGDLRQHDLKLGPCENKKYQKYDINVSATAQWLSGANDDEIEIRKNLVAQTYANNQAKDISTLIGRRLSRAEMLADVNKVVERFAQLNRSTSTSVSVPDLSALKQTSKDAPETTTVDTNTGEVTESGNADLKKMNFEDVLADLG